MDGEKDCEIEEGEEDPQRMKCSSDPDAMIKEREQLKDRGVFEFVTMQELMRRGLEEDYS